MRAVRSINRIRSAQLHDRPHQGMASIRSAGGGSSFWNIVNWQPRTLTRDEYARLLMRMEPGFTSRLSQAKVLKRDPELMRALLSDLAVTSRTIRGDDDAPTVDLSGAPHWHWLLLYEDLQAPCRPASQT